jgi:cobalt-zinc-cadmium efflux system membrane fusion protein
MANPPPVVTSPDGLTYMAKVRRVIWMTVSIMATFAIVASLLTQHRVSGPPPQKTSTTENVASVRAISRGLIKVSADTPLQKEMTTIKIAAERISLPVMSVGGTIVARIHQGSEPIEDRWQFDNPDLSTSYADWLRVKNEIEFAESQLSKTKALAQAETSYLETNLERFEGLTGGTIPEKDIRQAKSALLKAQLQGDKDIFGAQSALRAANKQKAAIERDLSRAGIEPIVFTRAAEDMVLVVAYVPEAKVSQAYEDQACEVQFYAYPDLVFPGHVEAISSVLTQERRTLRVLFDLTDTEQLLKPGMFAEVGLGTELRDAIVIPATSLMHIGKHDYVLVAADSDQWRVTEVRVGEIKDGRCEVRTGLKAGETIISKGVTLLLSIASESLKLPEAPEKK